MSRIRPMIKVWCLPPGQTEGNLNRLHREIVAAVLTVQELGFEDENGMICLFPPDLMFYGLGSEISIEITRLSLLGKPGRMGEICQRLARIVGSKVKELYPDARVECSSLSLDFSHRGFWSSIDDERP